MFTDLKTTLCGIASIATSVLSAVGILDTHTATVINAAVAGLLGVAAADSKRKRNIA